MAKKRLMIGIGIIIIIALIFLVPYLFPTSLKITKTQADPIKIAPGKYLTIFAEIQNKEEIESVYVEIPFEGGVDKIDMEKVASKFNKDIYQAKWLCHATANERWYQANITAIDILGNKVFSTVDFQDPTVNHTWPQLAGGNGCLISTTLSSCPNGYSADTRYDGYYLKYSESSIYNYSNPYHDHIGPGSSGLMFGQTGPPLQGPEGKGSGTDWLAYNSHTHEVASVTYSSNESNDNVPYINVIVCCRNP